MDIFYTITASNTKFCNDRSKRYDSVEEAISVAEERILSGLGGFQNKMIIMKSVKLVSKPSLALVTACINKGIITKRSGAMTLSPTKH